MELAEPFAMSQPAISKHLKVLERAGLISRGRDAQRRPCRLEAQPLAEANEWLERYRECWEQNFERLDVLLEEMKAAESLGRGVKTDRREGPTRGSRTNFNPRRKRMLTKETGKLKIGSKRRSRDRDDSRVQCTAQDGVRCLDEAGADAALAGRSLRMDDDGVRDRPEE